MDNFYALIMAGGGGTRLWPLSRRKRPKQMLPLISEESMFRIAVMRLALPLERIFVVTGESQVEDLRKEVPELPAENFILEPFGRDSGPAAGLGVAHIHQLNPDAVVAILTADHYIRDTQGFQTALEAAHEVAQQDYIVTLGIQPTYAATGFGYIQQAEPLSEVKGLTVYHSAGFKEKPDQDTAQKFIDSGLYAWNSGMFIWKASQAMAEFSRQQPIIYDHLMEISSHIGKDDYAETIQSMWETMPKISLDYAVMENAERVAMIPISIGWNDVGSWAAVHEILSTSGHDNIELNNTQHICIDSTGMLISSERRVVTIGVDDLVVIDTGDVLMICQRDRAQDVKQAVERLRDEGLETLL
jgi:mannose-1-phosphate guanylyltransferase